MSKASWDVGNDFKPERAVEMRRRRLKALRWLALMTAINAAGLVVAHFAPEMTRRAWHWAGEAITQIRAEGARPKTSLSPAVAADSGEESRSTARTSLFDWHESSTVLTSAIRLMQWLLLVGGALSVLMGLMQYALMKPCGGYFAIGLTCLLVVAAASAAPPEIIVCGVD